MPGQVVITVSDFFHDESASELGDSHIPSSGWEVNDGYFEEAKRVTSVSWLELAVLVQLSK